MHPLLLACSLMLVCCSCVHTAVVKTWEPAEIDVSGLNRVTVLHFTGEHGDRVSQKLAGKLGTNEFYTVVEEHKLASDVQLAAYAEPGDVPPDELLQSARSCGVDAVIRGEIIEYRCEDRIITDPGMNAAMGSNRDPFGRGGPYASVMAFDSKLVTERTGVVSMVVQVVDVHSGEVRVSRRVAHRYQDRIMGDPDRLPPQQDVLDNLTQRCLNDVLAMLAPHEGTCKIELATCDVWVSGRREVKLGVKLAEAGDWDAAEQRWRDALKVNPKNHAALFNLAVEADHRQMYTEAEEFARQALRLHHKDCYARGLETIRAHRAAFEKSEDQRDARVMTVSSEIWE